jgi:WD40 repeat protein
VALKILPSAIAKVPGAVERFYREARAAAALDHPNIVRAHDVDRVNGLHILVLEYIEGRNLQEIVAVGGPLSVTVAAEYTRQTALGLQHAFTCGLVHRDIKPANLLVDGTGTIKILDMGLARFFRDKEQLTKQFDAQTILGTADYLAPEQALNSHEADIRADIYGLGATLYYLLTGRGPFAQATSVAQKIISHQLGEPPSIRSLRADVPKELAAIVSRAMAKKPIDRFQTPDQVAMALAPWIAASPSGNGSSWVVLAAAPPAAPADLSRAAAPDTLAATAAAVPTLPSASFALRAGTPPSTGEPTPAPASWPRGDCARPASSSSLILTLDTQSSGAGLDRGAGRRTSRKLPGRHRYKKLGGVRLPWAVSALVVLFLVTTVVAVWAVSWRSMVLNPGEGRPGLLVERLCLRGHQQRVDQVAVVGGGQRLLSAGCMDRTLRLWDLESGQTLAAFEGHGGEVHGVAVAPPGRLAASVSNDRTVRLWDLEQGREVRVLRGHTQKVRTVTFCPDGRHIVTGGDDNTIRLWDTATGVLIRVLRGHERGVTAVAVAPDGRSILSGSMDRTVRLWDVQSGAETRRLIDHTGEVWAVAFTPDGKRVLSGGRDQVVRLWDVASGMEIRQLLGHTGGVRSVAVSPDGRYAASGGYGGRGGDTTVRLWDLETGQELACEAGHSGFVTSLAFARDGAWVASSSDDGTVRVWDLPR